MQASMIRRCHNPWQHIFGPRLEKTCLRGFAKQQRRRPAWASAQPDQRLCYSLFGKYHTYTCYKQNFNFLASLCSGPGWFESHLVGNPKDKVLLRRGPFIHMVLTSMAYGITAITSGVNNASSSSAVMRNIAAIVKSSTSLNSNIKHK